MARRSSAVALLLAVMALVIPLEGVAAVAPTMRARVVQSGLTNPWDIAFAPGGQMIVTERPGRVRVYRNGGVRAALLATTRIGKVRAEGESGVMGIALHPKFNSYRLVYICASRQVNGRWRNQLLRYRMDSSWRLHFQKVLVRNIRANTIHNGCAVEIGPDGKIWMSTGDAGNGNRSQNPNSLNGKILRLNKNGSVPSDNPIMPGASSRTIVYTMGHRNPQGIAFEPGTDRVYAVEHGPTVNDEINLLIAGRNYGWPCVTGFGSPYQACAGGGPFEDPVWASGGSTIANSGGTFVKGAAWGHWSGQLFTAQLKESDLRRYRLNSAGTVATRVGLYFNNRWGRLRAAVLGPHNRMWLTTSNGSNDKVIRIIPH